MAKGKSTAGAKPRPAQQSTDQQQFDQQLLKMMAGLLAEPLAGAKPASVESEEQKQLWRLRYLISSVQSTSSRLDTLLRAATDVALNLSAPKGRDDLQELDDAQNLLLIAKPLPSEIHRATAEIEEICLRHVPLPPARGEVEASSNKWRAVAA